jgi:hypothetical protein
MIGIRSSWAKLGSRLRKPQAVRFVPLQRELAWRRPKRCAKQVS